MPKKINYKYTHNRSIVEFTFVSIPRRGWFKEHVQPAIDFIKGTVPATARSYDAATYKWEVAVEWWPALELFFKSQWFSLIEQTPNKIPNIEVPQDYAESFYRAPEPISTKESTESIAAKLSEYLGVTITTQDMTELKSLYRQQARKLHPDMGGDASKMSELNRLWTLFTATERSVN